METLTRRFSVVGAVFAFLSVALGAFGAHGLKAQISVERMQVYQTAIEYQTFHALAILFLACFVSRCPRELHRNLNTVFKCFVFGVIVFCGSLYSLALTDLRWLGAITPIGGTAFLIGWGLLIYGLVRIRPNDN